MSVVVTIKRSDEKPPLTGEEFRRVVEQDSSLSGREPEPIIWTDDMRGDEDGICRFLDKLRSLSRILDARVFGEGEDITEPTPAPDRRAGCTSVLLCALAPVVVLGIVMSSWT